MATQVQRTVLTRLEFSIDVYQKTTHPITKVSAKRACNGDIQQIKDRQALKEHYKWVVLTKGPDSKEALLINRVLVAYLKVGIWTNPFNNQKYSLQSGRLLGGGPEEIKRFLQKIRFLKNINGREFIPFENSMQPGRGINSDGKVKTKIVKGVLVDCNEGIRAGTINDYKEIKSKSGKHSCISAMGQASASIACFEVSGALKFMNSIEVDGTQQKIIVLKTDQLGSMKKLTNPTIITDSIKERMKRDPRGFIQMYGTHFISGYYRVASFFGCININAQSEERATELSGKVRANLKLPKEFFPQAGGAGVSVEGSAGWENINTTSDEEITVSLNVSGINLGEQGGAISVESFITAFDTYNRRLGNNEGNGAGGDAPALAVCDPWIDICQDPELVEQFEEIVREYKENIFQQYCDFMNKSINNRRDYKNAAEVYIYCLGTEEDIHYEQILDSLFTYSLRTNENILGFCREIRKLKENIETDNPLITNVLTQYESIQPIIQDILIYALLQKYEQNPAAFHGLIIDIAEEEPIWLNNVNTDEMEDRDIPIYRNIMKTDNLKQAMQDRLGDDFDRCWERLFPDRTRSIVSTYQRDRISDVVRRLRQEPNYSLFFQKISNEFSNFSACSRFIHLMEAIKEEATDIYEHIFKNEPLVIQNLAQVYAHREIAESDHVRVLDFYYKSAEIGYIDSQFRLGAIYQHGLYGVEQNLEEAVIWYRKAADQKHVKSLVWLGRRHLVNIDGVARDYSKAVELFRQAAEQEYPQAYLWLGICCYNGLGVARDYSKAVELFRQAAEREYPQAYLWLGTCYYNGLGIARDYSKAVEWFEKAVAQEYIAAYARLGRCYYNGLGVARDYSKAAELFRQAAEQDCLVGRSYLSICYKYGRGVPQNRRAARKWSRMPSKKRIS